MAEVVILINFGLNQILFGSMFKDIIRMIIGAFSGIVVYFIVTMLFNANELKTLLKKE